MNLQKLGTFREVQLGRHSLILFSKEKSTSRLASVNPNQGSFELRKTTVPKVHTMDMCTAGTSLKSGNKNVNIFIDNSRPSADFHVFASNAFAKS